MNKQEKKERRIIYISVIASILLHIFGLIIFNYKDLWSSSVVEQPNEAEPLELVFEQPQPETTPESQLPDQFYELVENPNATADEPESSNMLSTESSLSQAPIISSNDLRAIPGEEVEENQPQQPAEESPPDPKVQEAIQDALLAYRENISFDRSALTGNREENESEPENKSDEESKKIGETSESPSGFNADLVGDFALSTYGWNWAPYWLAFKRKLLRVWYAPPAYYELGLIHGHTIVRFKVSREGKMYDFKVLRHVGHGSLQESSVIALQACFPFKPLPKDFPEEFLEVSIKMVYPNLRELMRTKK
jgi:outer membrane biosynthesis protein TonB